MHPDKTVIRFATAAMMFLPSVVYASEKVNPLTAAEQEGLIHEVASKGGMPQLDFANKLTVSQIVWGAIIFAVFYLLLSRWALPRVGAVLETREATISTDLDSARAAKAKADTATAELTDAILRARAEAQSAISAAIDQAKQAAAAQAAESNARLEAQISAAEQRIGVARAAAMGALREVATDTANAVVSRLTGISPDSARIDQAVGTLLAARGQA